MGIPETSNYLQFTPKQLHEFNTIGGLYANTPTALQPQYATDAFNKYGVVFGNKIPTATANQVLIGSTNTPVVASVSTPSALTTNPFVINNKGILGIGQTYKYTGEASPYAELQTGLINKGAIDSDQAFANLQAYNSATPEMKQAMMYNSNNMVTEITKSAPTMLDWGKFGLNALNSVYGMYMGNKNLKLQKQNFEEQKALNRANFKMQARSYSNSLRNQMSGRSFTGMSGAAQRMLGRDYNARKTEETY